MKAMIFQPMFGMTEAQITAGREKAIRCLEGLGYEVINKSFDGILAKPPKKVKCGIWFIAKALEMMAECGAVYFCLDADGMQPYSIERVVAKIYGLTCIDETVDEVDKHG